MSKLKGFFAACALVLTVSALLAGVCTGSARAGGVVFFIDDRHGWQSTLRGNPADTDDLRATAWHTVNGGANWKQQATGPAAFTGGGASGGFFAFATPSTGIWARASHSVLRTTNAGASWSSVGAVAQTWLNDASFATSRVGWACSEISTFEGGSIVKTADAGATWQVQKRIAGRSGTGGFMQVSCPSASSCYVLGRGTRLGGLWATADGGKQWARRALPDGGVWTAIDFPTATTGWAVGPGGAMATTTDGGKTWRSVEPGAANDLFDISFCNAMVGYASSEGFVWRTTDGGVTWAAQGILAENLSPISAVDCVDPAHTWVVDSHGDVFATSDGGNTWNWNRLPID